MKLLKPGGTFVTKVMRKDTNVFKNFFEEVEFIKPKSSRSDSDEIFVICYDFKGEKNGIHGVLFLVIASFVFWVYCRKINKAEK